MWLWQRRKPKGKELFFAELIGVSAGLHILVALLFFVCGSGHYESFSVEIHRDATKKKIPVLFLPYGGRRIGALHGHGMTGATNRLKGTAVATKKSEVLKKTTVKQPRKESVKNEVQAPLAKTTLAGKCIKKKSDAKKKKKVKERKPVEQKTKASEPKPEPKKEEKAPEPVKPKEEPKSVPVKQPIESEKKMVNDIPPVESVVAEQEQPAAIMEESDLVEFAMGDNTALADGECEVMSFEQARIYIALQEELNERWKPPVGLAKDLACTVAACVDREGRVADVAVKVPSGVLVYDISARQAVQQMSLPPYAWGREFSIVFRQ
jgi:outer membrane biosynthesis protein TonB